MESRTNSRRLGTVRIRSVPATPLTDRSHFSNPPAGPNWPRQPIRILMKRFSMLNKKRRHYDELALQQLQLLRSDSAHAVISLIPRLLFIPVVEMTLFIAAGYANSWGMILFALAMVNFIIMLSFRLVLRS